MSIFDRRSPSIPTRSRRYTCEHCEWYSYDPDATLGHMFSLHINRRVRTVKPNPGRRLGDGHSPSVARFLAAGQRGEGLSTDAARARGRLS